MVPTATLASGRPAYGRHREERRDANSLSMLTDLNKRCKDMMATSPSGWHYEVLDEVNLLTPAAMAGQKTAITFTNSTIYILTTNHPSKLDKGVRDHSILVGMNQPQPAA